MPDPENVNAMCSKDFELFNVGRYQEAIEWYDKPLEVDPNDV